MLIELEIRGWIGREVQYLSQDVMDTGTDGLVILSGEGTLAALYTRPSAIKHLVRASSTTKSASAIV